MKKNLYRLISNYYWLYFFVSLIVFVTHKDLNSVLAALTIFVGFVSIMQTKKNVDVLDWLVVVYILYALGSYFFYSYDFELYYYGIRYQLIFTLFYFIGRDENRFLLRFYDKFKTPMLWAFVSGLILYFWSPSWYIQPKLDLLPTWANTYQIQEATRLSSIWPHAYFCGYSALFYLMYLISKKVVRNESEKYFALKICIALSTLFFAQLRVSIAFFVAFIFVLCFYSEKKRLPGRKPLKKIVIVLSFFCVVAFFLIFQNMGGDFTTYVADRSFSSDGNFILKRIHMFDSFLRYVDINGQGLGRFGHHALTMGKMCISDNEYMRVLCELGFIGLTIIMLIVVLSLLKAVRYFRELHFEFFVICFFLVAMIGAAPLEMAMQQNFLFWFCIGKIRTFNPQRGEYEIVSCYGHV